ncbi:nucleoside diphosphate kinase regulator [candidate division KSB1 bacterium]|nr:MAG: nucleoside diphosphate kinase regulator [candidate division KSB1 bacterium]
MPGKLIYITQNDMRKLQHLLVEARALLLEDEKYLSDLEFELARAKVVKSNGVPADVITMNSQVRLEDATTQEEMVCWLVYPDYANDEHGKISILSPTGTALIGCKVGDLIEPDAAAGVPTLRVEEILYQPEADGKYHL